MRSMINWNDVIRYANKGVPAPDRRVEKTEAEWKELLSEEEFLHHPKERNGASRYRRIMQCSRSWEIQLQVL